jgi:fumarylacetoacetate (FAA) hydrolase
MDVKSALWNYDHIALGVSNMKLCSFVGLHEADTFAAAGVVHDNVVTRLDCANVLEWLERRGDVAELESYDLESVRLLAPIAIPPSIRDFFAFEGHVQTTRTKRGQEVPPFWYEAPVFYFTNPAAVIGPDDTVAYPIGTEMLDYELEVAAVIGADQRIAGFTIFNDWSARDLQRAEISVGLGPAKGKDFATSMGPYLVTVDEFDGSSGTMTTRINGVEHSRGELATLHYSWQQIVERAALNTQLRTGDVLGSGTVATGCLLEANDPTWLQPGDVVEMEVEGLGVLRNVVGERPPQRQ